MAANQITTKMVMDTIYKMMQFNNLMINKMKKNL